MSVIQRASSVVSSKRRHGGGLGLELWAALLIASGGVCASGQALAAAPSVEREASYTFAFQDAQISQVCEEVFGSLGVSYTLDPGVTGTISFRIDQRLTKIQLLQAFEAALAANNVALVRNGDSLTVTPRARARAATGVRAVGEGVHRAGFEVVAVPLSYAVASEVKKALEAISGEGTVIYANDQTGLIILSGSGQELQSTLETLKLFDQSGLQSSKIRWFELSQAAAGTVAGELDDVVRAAAIGGIKIVPLKRLNGLIVFGRTSSALDEISQWVFRLDAPTKDTASSLWVYRPKNTSAEALGKTLSALTSGQMSFEQTGAPSRRGEGVAATRDLVTMPATSAGVSPSMGASASASSGEDEAVRVAVDKDTNTLLVSAPAWRWLQIQKILAEIDRPQDQVLIEASIIEVTLSDNFRLGVDWSVFGASDKLNVSSVNNRAGTIGPTYPGFSLTFLDTDIQAAVTALGARTKVEVVSAPKIVTLDNRPARLQVGDQVPVVTQTSQGTTSAGSPLISTIDYRNSGVILSVTPRISGEDRVVLDIAQEVSSVIETTTSGIDSPTIQQRKLESTLVLRNGGVVALGGLISRSRNSGDSGVPGLKDIPGLGHLFKSSSQNLARTELIVLLSAKIIKDAPGASQVMKDLLADMREINARGLDDVAR